MEVRVPSWPTVLERREGFDNDESTMMIEGALFLISYLLSRTSYFCWDLTEISAKLSAFPQRKNFKKVN